MTKVLIVDDSKLMRLTIKKYLKTYPLEVIDADNGNDAVRLFNESNPEIVTLDLTLPGKDGFDCLEEMVSKNPHIKVLIVSAIKDMKTRINLLNLGASAFLTKPITEVEFTKAFTKLME